MGSYKLPRAVMLSTNDFMYVRLIVNIMPSGESGIC